jgi:hypothetical protein
MPEYIKKKLQEYEHARPSKPQNCPYSSEPKQYGSEAQSPLRKDTSKLLDNSSKKQIQKIVGNILFYAWAVDMKVSMALSTIAMSQAAPTEQTMEYCIQLLDYLAMHADAKIKFYESDMIMNIHLDATYLSESKAYSRACGHFYMGSAPIDGQPIKLTLSFPGRPLGGHLAVAIHISHNNGPIEMIPSGKLIYFVPPIHFACSIM